MNIIQAPEHILKTVDIKEYYNLFNTYFAVYGVQKKAWQIIESERESIGLPPRYNSFETFKSAKYQYYKRINKKKEEYNPLQIRLF